MGDFNMSLFKVVPELRSLGVHAALISCFPWLSKERHELMADSCGIFVLVPAAITPAVPTEVCKTNWWQLPYLPTNGGPGQKLQTYLPKADDDITKIKGSLEPVAVASKREDEPGGDAPAVAGQTTAPPAVAGKGKASRQPNERQGLAVREKRLDMDIWMYQGANHKGSHFPLAAFTKNVGRRSEERYVERSKRRQAKKQWIYPQ